MQNIININVVIRGLSGTIRIVGKPFETNKFHVQLVDITLTISMATNHIHKVFVLVDSYLLQEVVLALVQRQVAELAWLLPILENQWHHSYK